MYLPKEDRWASFKPSVVVIQDYCSRAIVGYHVADPSRRSGLTADSRPGIDKDELLAALLSTAMPDIAPAACRAYAGSLQSQHANGSSRRSEQDRRAFIRLQSSIERLCDETLLMCEVCGGPVPQPPMEFRKRTLCEDHCESVIHPDEDGREADDDPDADLPW